MLLIEIFIILVVAIIVLGPKHIQDLALFCGRCMRFGLGLIERLQQEFASQIKQYQLKQNIARAEEAERKQLETDPKP